jgi:hypothetical protein
MKFAFVIATFVLFIKVIISKKLKSKSTTKYSQDILDQGEKLESQNGHYYAIMQSDGNFVIYSTPPNNGKNNNNPVWWTGTHGQGVGPYKISMQNDGNCVLYDSKQKPLWHTSTYNKAVDPPYSIIMQDDGNMVIYNSRGKHLWNSSSYMKK